ncbi:peptide deformylase [Cellulomonas sp. NTE-D12]|uniref:peptide deformylase n=1 Tax=Cellulomonas sp. NTE-D12 TaxID=2962632 RepID=UPI003081FC96|nr:peptide deformylase 1 [Cellulomonas sp. NTE-D12]
MTASDRSARDHALRDHALRLVEAAAARPDGLAPIVRAGHPALRAVAVPFDGQLSATELAALLSLMRRTMRAAPGVGLAAPQVGLPLALAVLEDPGVGSPEVATVRERQPLAPRVLVNPRYAPLDDERVSFYEGCLSVVGYQAVVARHRSVRLTGQDEHGEPLDEVVDGWTARIVQHETDHLAGTLYLDRAELRSLSATDELGARWAAEPRPVTASRTLGFPLD